MVDGFVSTITAGGYGSLRSQHTRPRVQSAPGFPCALCLEGANEFAKLGRNRAARMRAHALSPRRPGLEPGPIRRGGNCKGKMVDGFASTTTACDYGSRPPPGRRSWCCRRSRSSPNRPSLSDNQTGTLPRESLAPEPPVQRAFISASRHSLGITRHCRGGTTSWNAGIFSNMP